jgi:prephenate dehydrogenase
VQLAFLGLGQIGGSVARAALAAGFATRVRAWTPTGRGPAMAAGDGIAAAASIEDAVDGAQVVVLAAPPLACLDLLDALGRLDRRVLGDAVVTDVASTKATIVERAAELRLRFVGGHPMAGREAGGYEASDPALVRDRPWVGVPGSAAAEAAARVAALATACGARPIRMTAAEHDEAVALISHAPLVVAAALAQAAERQPGWPAAAALAAGGWASMTRLARGDPEMGAGILATNRVATAHALRAIGAALEEWIRELESGVEPAGLRTRLEAARDAAAER